MKKIVYMLYDEGIQKPVVAMAREQENVSCFSDFRAPLVHKLFEWHNAWPLNKMRELPFKSLWFGRVMKDLKIDEKDEIWFLMYESFHFSYSKSFLTMLRKRYGKARLCFKFTNPVTEQNRGKFNTVRQYYDAAITFSRKDAEENGFLYWPLQPMKICKYEAQEKYRSDIFFVGKDKGRLDILLDCYEKFTQSGLKCDFHIVEVPPEKQKYTDRIAYNQRIPYSEVLEREASTRCVLEILQNNEDYMSMRATEAFCYGKKLITNSKAYRDYPFYDPGIIWILDDIDAFDSNFVLDETQTSRSFQTSAFEDFRDFLLKIDRKY